MLDFGRIPDALTAWTPSANDSLWPDSDASPLPTEQTGALPPPDAPAARRDWPHVAACLLDEVDYAVLLVDATGRLRFANHSARFELAQSTAMCLLPQECGEDALQCIDREDQLALTQAIREAAQGRRSMVRIGHAPHEFMFTVTPMREGGIGDGMDGGATPLVGLIAGRQESASDLSYGFFVRLYGLSTSEAAVLRHLCRGESTSETARLQGVAVSTVRTQIQQVRFKTGTSSTRQLMARVAALPPMVPSVRLLMHA